MLVVLDTDVMKANLNGVVPKNNLKLVLMDASQDNLVLVVPEIVVLELVNQRREHIEDAVQKFRQAALPLASLGIEPDLPNVDEQALTDAYEGDLRDLLERWNVQVAAIPNLPHEWVVRRDLARRKPFSEKGKGYRDALIWETFLDALRETGDEGVFLTLNRRDFAAGKSPTAFHADLLGDLSTAGVPGTTRLVCDLDEFVKASVSPLTIATDEFESLMAEDPAAWTSLSSEVHFAIDGLLLSNSDRREIELRDLELPRSTMDAVIEEAWITEPQPVTHVNFSLVQVLDERRLLLDLEATLNCTIEAQLEVELEPEPWADLPKRRNTHHASVSKRLTVGLETMLDRSTHEFSDTSVYHVGL